MNKLLTITMALAIIGLAAPAMGQWVSQPADPGLWPYADGPLVENVALKDCFYRMAGIVAEIDGEEVLAAVGGRTITTYSKYLPGSDPKYWDNRQSHFSIFTPTSFDSGGTTYLGGTWDSAFGGDDILTSDPDGVPNSGDEVWTSTGLTGYNNGNGTNSPTVGQGTGYTSDQGFYYDGGIYVFGGYPQWGGNMAKYTIATNSWSAVPLGDNDGLYMDGGGLIGSHWYKVHKAGFLCDYDASTDTWGADIAVSDAGTGLIPLPDPAFGAASGVIGNKLYIADTYDAAGALYEIDPVAGTFVQLASANTPVGQAGSVVYNGRLFLLGGRTEGAGASNIDKIQYFQVNTGTWHTSTTVLPSARSGHLAEIVNGNLYVGNGYTDDGVNPAFLPDDLWVMDMDDVAVPEPSTMLLLGSGLLGLLAILRRKK
jgi:hypothetical protein